MGNADQNQSGPAPILPIDVPTDPAAGDASWDRWFPPEAAQQGMRTPSGAVPVVSPSASPVGAATSSGSPAQRHTAGQVRHGESAGGTTSSGTHPIPARPLPAQPIAIPARPIQARPVGGGAAQATPVSAARSGKK